MILTQWHKLSYCVSLQCSVPCGYGIQSRTVSCLGPSKSEPLSPLLCMHMPKPITIQGCYMGSCGDMPPTLDVVSDATTATQTVKMVNLTEGPLLSPTLSHTDTPQHRMGRLPPLPTETITIPQTTMTTTPAPKGINTLILHPLSVRAKGRWRIIVTVCALFQVHVDSYSLRNQAQWIWKT